MEDPIYRMMKLIQSRFIQRLGEIFPLEKGFLWGINIRKWGLEDFWDYIRKCIVSHFILDYFGEFSVQF
jgi:hypothetical protein